MTRVSIILPCRNERAHLAATLDSLLAQDAHETIGEILVADGMSDDGTRAILESYARRHPVIRVIDNPEGVTPAALRLLLAQASGDYIVRVDAHAVFPPDYVSTLIRHLASGAADNVGGVIRTVAGHDSATARVIADCLCSRFGVGQSFRTRTGREPVVVETVPFGAWRADHFTKFGPFDPRFIRAQDLEHNLRVRRAGGRILCLPWLIVTYFARDSFPKLKRMALQYGYWKLPVRQLHPVPFSLRQYAPPLLLVVLFGALALSPVIPMLLALPAGYLAANLAVAIALARRAGHPAWWPLYAYAFAILHYYYGAGYLRGLWDITCRRRWRFAEISR